MRISSILTGVTLTMAAPLAAAPSSPFPLDEEGEAWVRGTLESMTLEQRVGQLIMPRIPSRAGDDPEVLAETIELIKELEVGAFIVGGPSAEDRVPVLNALQEASPVPLLICADFECGVGRVWSDATRFPRQMALAATGDPETARFMGEVTAREGRACGVHWPLVPICDVNINPENPIINIRSFGEDVDTVAACAVAFTQGVQANGGIACAKHYPGHGDTATDSHMELAHVLADRERLEAVEFPPFQAAVDAGVATVMTSHVWFPALMLDEGEIPATVSRNVLTGLLRGDMGFEGMIVTDSMRMRGITDHLPAGEAAVATLLAGADGILVSRDDHEARAMILAAVHWGVLSEERIAESAERILRAKAWLGLHRGATVDVDAALASLQRPEDVAGAREIAQQAITVVRDEEGLLPLDPEQVENVMLISLFDSFRRWNSREFAPIAEGLSDRFENATAELVLASPERRRVERFVEVSEEDSDEDLARRFGLSQERRRDLLTRAAEADVVVATAHVRVSSYKGEIWLSDDQMNLIRALAELETPLVLAVTGSPYLPTALPELPCQIVTYDDSWLIAEILPAALAGEFPLTGRLPVTLPGVAPLGHGLQIPARE
jgi:beta-N-acetylhexosaminidase